MKIQHMILATAMATMPVAMVAQTAQTTTPAERHDINGRRADEQGRIKQGEASGQETHGEAKNLEAHQAAIHNQEKSDRAADGGHLTSADRHQLAHEQNKQSQRIYDDKHNAATKPGVPPQ